MEGRNAEPKTKQKEQPDKIGVPVEGSAEVE